MTGWHFHSRLTYRLRTLRCSSAYHPHVIIIQCHASELGSPGAVVDLLLWVLFSCHRVSSCPVVAVAAVVDAVVVVVVVSIGTFQRTCLLYCTFNISVLILTISFRRVSSILVSLAVLLFCWNV